MIALAVAAQLLQLAQWPPPRQHERGIWKAICWTGLTCCCAGRMDYGHCLDRFRRFILSFLDNNLVKPQSPDLLETRRQRCHGRSMAGLYNPQKYLGAPKQIPPSCTGFTGRAYSTRLTGFALFTVLYLFNASAF